MNIILFKILGITLVGIFVFSTMGFAEAGEDKVCSMCGQPLKNIGKTEETLRDEVSSKKAELPVYKSEDGDGGEVAGKVCPMCGQPLPSKIN